MDKYKDKLHPVDAILVIIVITVCFFFNCSALKRTLGKFRHHLFNGGCALLTAVLVILVFVERIRIITLQKATVPMMSRVTAAKSCHCKLEKGKLQNDLENFRHICGLEVNANLGKVPKPNCLFTSGKESRRRLWQRLGTA